MDQFSGISLKTRLYLLVLVAFIPVTMIIFYVTEEQKAIEKDAILHKTRLMAQMAAETENLQVEATRDLTVTVAETFDAVDGEPERLTQFLSNLLDHANGYMAFGIVDPTGNLIAGSHPDRMENDYAGRKWLSSSLARQDLVMGSYHGERIDGQPVIYFARSIFDSSGGAAAVVFAALNLNWMNRGFFRQLGELPVGSRLILANEDQLLLRYEVDTARWASAQPFDPGLRIQIESRPSGVLTADDEDGRTWIYAFARLESSFQQGRVYVVLEIPLSVAMATSNRIFARNLILLIISAFMAVLAIWWAADIFILRRVGAMVHASRQLAAGDFQARIGRIGIRDELSHLAEVFDKMAQTLQMRIEREEQAKAFLKESREQLRQLSAYQNDVREQERIRIAREIHDQFGQSLTILKMDLAWMKRHLSTVDSAVDEKLAAMLRLILEAMDNLHDVTSELRPVILDDFGLAAAIEWQAETFRRRSGIGCRLQNNGYEPELTKDQATALFRIFQELLTNIIRHAEADDVIVRLEKHDGGIMLQVTDNGRGITEDEIDSPHAFGLLGIRERLHPLGGWVVFEGRPGQGTRVTIRLPLHQEGGPL
ncbi:MAG: ATP-binding protein [Desulfobacterales bacterium]|jgi:signal transduction histidine kinase